MSAPLNQYPVKQFTHVTLDDIQKLIAQYYEPIPLEVDNKMRPVVDNNGYPVLDGQIGYVAGRVYIFGQYMQREENIQWALLTQTNLASARGATLDRWGVLLNVTRQGLADGPYLQILQLVIIEYTSQGNIETLIQVIKIVTGASKVVLQEFFPAKFQITALGGSPLVPVASVNQFIQQTKAGGVGFKVVLGSPRSFGFAGNPLAGTFGDGNLADIITLKSGSFAGAIS